MQGLGETTAMLARLKRQMEAAAGGAGADREGVMTETPQFWSNPGRLRMLSYVPEGLRADAPLVVVLHGCTQRAAAFAQDTGWLALADRFGFAVLAPEQSTANNMNRCFNWFVPESTRRGGGEVASIAGMIGYLVQTHGLDPARVFITGLSAGGAMTCAMLATYPELFAAGAVVAGLPYGVAGDMAGALQLMNRPDRRDGAALARLVRGAAPAADRWPRLTIWHGDADATVNSGHAADIAAQWAGAMGLPEAPSLVANRTGGTQQVWRDPQTNEPMIELNMLRGLGHGAPLSTRGPDALGAAGAFMLECGVSSSLEIAAFWGIDTPWAERPAAQARPEAAVAAPPGAREAHAHAGVGDTVMASLRQHVPAPVQDVISKALRAAGLMA